LFHHKLEAILSISLIAMNCLRATKTGFFAVCLASLIPSCTSQKKSMEFSPAERLHLLGKYELPYNLQFQQTTVGGLSGIDYDKKNDVYYLISDDRSSINPARFYTAKIILGKNGIDSIRFVDVKYLLQPNGNVYPSSRQDPSHTPDPEGIRLNARTRQLVWTSEGERIIRKTDTVLADPSITIIDPDGNFRDSFMLPSNMHMQLTEKGPRQNSVFEGLSFMKNYKNLLVSVEEPLYEDGPRAGLNDSSAMIRIISFDVRKRRPLAQYVYEIDPVAYPSNPPGAFKINGVPDILALNDHQLLVIERSFSTGRKPSTIKLFLAELKGADNVSDKTIQKGTVHAIQKSLLLNMDALGIYVDNVEGITLGPVLQNGHRSLVLVADNNFSVEQITQFFLFEIE
jgi:hypothetical protein